jgi:hypothetical protein
MGIKICNGKQEHGVHRRRFRYLKILRFASVVRLIFPGYSSTECLLIIKAQRS